MGCRGAPDLDESALLQGEQLLIHQGEGQPEEIREVLAGAASLHVEHLQDQVANRVGREAGDRPATRVPAESTAIP